MTDLKPPFKIYAIEPLPTGTFELDSATVVRVTAAKWWFKGKAGVAFGGLSSVPKDNTYALSPRQAWKQFKQVAIDKLNAAQRDIDVADAAVTALGENDES